MMSKESLQNQGMQEKIKNWIITHSAGIALAVALWSLLRVTGLIDMVFNFFASPKEMHEQIVSFGLSVALPSLDIISLFLAGAAIVIGWKTMRRHGGFWKKGKGGFVIGVLCLVISFTPIGTACSLVSTAIPVWAKTVYYGLTNQPEKMNEYSQIMNGGGNVDLKEGEYLLDAHIDRTEDPAYGTKMKVVGTLTNQTEDTWDSVSISFVLVDANGEPKKVQSYDEVPVLEATIKGLKPGETAEFESRTYPGILESDYEGITDYKIVSISYWKPLE